MQKNKEKRKKWEEKNSDRANGESEDGPLTDLSDVTYVINHATLVVECGNGEKKTLEGKIVFRPVKGGDESEYATS